MNLKNAKFIPKNQVINLKDTPVIPDLIRYKQSSFKIEDSEDEETSNQIDNGRFIVPDDFFYKGCRNGSSIWRS